MTRGAALLRVASLAAAVAIVFVFVASTTPPGCHGLTAYTSWT